MRFFPFFLLLCFGFTYSFQAKAQPVGSYAAQKAFETFMATVTGTGAQTITFGGSGTPLPTSTTTTGQKVGNITALADPATKGLEVKGSASLPLGTSGKSVPVSMTGKIAGSALTNGLKVAKALAGGWGLVGAFMAGAAFDRWLKDADLTVGPDGKFVKKTDGINCLSDCYEYAFQSNSGMRVGNFTDVYSSMVAGGNYISGGQPHTNTLIGKHPDFTFDVKVGTYTYHLGFDRRPVPPYNTVTFRDISEVEAMLELEKVPPDPEILEDMYTIDKTGRYTDKMLKDLSITNVVASGPATVPGPEVKTDVPAQNGQPAQTKVEKTDYNCVYVTATVSCTEKKTVTDTSTAIDPATGKPQTTTTTSTQEKSPEPSDDFEDKDLPKLEKLYEPKYKDGITGVWKEKKADFEKSLLLNLVGRLMPSVGSSGTCPQFMISLDVGFKDFGVHDVAPPCWIWDFGKIVIIFSALLLARALIFGG